MSTLQRLSLSFLAAVAVFPLIPSRAAEIPDPKKISTTLPDEIQWRKGPNAESRLTRAIRQNPASTPSSSSGIPAT